MDMAEKDPQFTINPSDDGPPSSAGRQVLIAEDEVLVAWSLVEDLHRLGYRVCGTVSTQEAVVDATVHLKPDIILMDYRLSGGDGLTAARKIRAALDVPIIFCTAYADGLSSEVLSLSDVQVVAKPVQSNKLQEALARATLSKRRS